MSVLEWSSTAMAARYQHVTAAVRRGVACQIGGLLWKPSATQSCNHNGNGRAALTGGPAVCAGDAGGGCGIRTREGVNPTRFPSLTTGDQGRSSLGAVQVRPVLGEPTSLRDCHRTPPQLPPAIPAPPAGNAPTTA
jgi:hypothetical protein